MARGRRPAPTALKVLRGDKPSRINRSEPKPEQRLPRMPAWLDAAAKEVWKRLAPALHKKGLLTEWDRDTFAVFCQAVVHHREACRLLRSGLLVINSEGRRVKNPAAQLVRDSANIIRGFAQEFGLTPSARSGIKLPEADDDELAGILSG